jgi:hypothetical protein
MGACYIHRVQPLLVANWILLIGSFGFVSAGLFSYLGDSGPVTNGRMYASFSRCLILGMFWWAVYSLLETIHRGSFFGTGLPFEGRATALINICWSAGGIRRNVYSDTKGFSGSRQLTHGGRVDRFRLCFALS